jgi:hypothetical protein
MPPREKPFSSRISASAAPSPTTRGAFQWRTELVGDRLDFGAGVRLRAERPQRAAPSRKKPLRHSHAAHLPANRAAQGHAAADDNSVEPPPMSITSRGSSDAGNVRTPR